jgi:hypothetical protein
VIHLTLQQLSAYLDDELPEASVELVRRHLSQCPECTVRFAKVEALEEILVRLLHHDPGDAFFDFFRDSITFDDGGAAGHAKRPLPAKPPHAAKEPRAAKHAPAGAEPREAKKLAAKKSVPAAPVPVPAPAPAPKGPSADQIRADEARRAQERREAEERAARARREEEERAVTARLEAEEQAARERREAVERAARELREEEERLAKQRREAEERAAKLRREDEERLAKLRQEEPARVATAREEEEARLAKARREEAERLERLRRDEEERAAKLRQEEEAKRAAKLRREEELRLAEALRERQHREQEALREKQRLEQEELLAKLRRSSGPAVSPVLYGRREEDRQPRRSGGMGAAWIAAVILVVLGVSVAVIVARTRPAAPGGASSSTPPDAPAPDGISAPDGEPGSVPSDQPADDEGRAPAPRIEPEAPVTESADTAMKDDAAPPPAAAAAKRRAPAPRARTEATADDVAPERLVERAPRNMVPVRTIITTTNTEPRLESDVATAAERTTAPAAAGQAAKSDPRRGFDRAKRLSVEAAHAKNATAYESAAAAWDEALPGLAVLPEEEALARRELAQARFQAWAIDPTPARRESAVKAARAYLLFAPPGPERDQAWTWLGRLKH